MNTILKTARKYLTPTLVMLASLVTVLYIMQVSLENSSSAVSNQSENNLQTVDNNLAPDGANQTVATNTQTTSTTVAASTTRAGETATNDEVAVNDTEAAPAAADANQRSAAQSSASGVGQTPSTYTGGSGGTATMMVAGGCFWCVEADLEKLYGVTNAVSGYAGGTTDNPTYETYAESGHREVVQVTYNTSVLTYEDILIYTMKHMDPTDGSGSFGDRGVEYAPAFYYDNQQEQTIIQDLITEVNQYGPYDAPLQIAVEPTPTFHEAEAYHQDYYSGALTRLKYSYYRRASGRDDFIAENWGSDTDTELSWRANS